MLLRSIDNGRIRPSFTEVSWHYQERALSDFISGCTHVWELSIISEIPRSILIQSDHANSRKLWLQPTLHDAKLKVHFLHANQRKTTYVPLQCTHFVAHIFGISSCCLPREVRADSRLLKEMTMVWSTWYMVHVFEIFQIELTGSAGDSRHCLTQTIKHRTIQFS